MKHTIDGRTLAKDMDNIPSFCTALLCIQTALASFLPSNSLYKKQTMETMVSGVNYISTLPNKKVSLHQHVDGEMSQKKSMVN